MGRTGIGVLLRAALRRDRVVLPIVVLLLVLETVANAGLYSSLYPTAADRARLTTASASNAAMRALYGPVFDLSTAGGFTAWRVGGFVATCVGLMAMLLVIRHTRADEETGRTELIRSQPLGRHAVLASALLTCAVGGLAVGVLAAIGLIVLGLPVGGSLTLGAGFTLTALVFAGVGGVAAQLAERARTARALAGSVLGLSYIARAVGDSSTPLHWCSWLSPIGWAERLRPFAGDRVGPAALSIAATIVLVLAAALLESRRDLGAGMYPARAGRPRASRALNGIAPLAARLQWAPLTWWAGGLLITGFATGSIASGLLETLRDTPSALTLLQRMGGRGALVDTYFAAVIPTIAVVALAQGVAVIARLSTEESTGRAELLLSTPVNRRAMLAAHVGWALLGAVLLMVALGLGLGLGYTAAGGPLDQLIGLIGACLAQVPAMWVVIAAGAGCLGLSARLAPVPWALLVGCVALAWLGPLLRLPGAVMGLSPFSHLTDLPGSQVAWTVLSACAALAGVGLAAAAVAYRRRDISG
ncbi:ABC transporter permease [Leekyejoonella antrihumi]|uniref:ABC transporter permease n=1 Tax=Leekyejoonella antrihumi TaxID=1660198 RepID=A0A563E2N5_9MICO|nr:ABC transporter permease [Leekyejoonella antrihumi]TWP36797.1 ABC transporter permease [Leekyejoonella antrihumi]